jgi:hypothetical protein
MNLNNRITFFMSSSSTLFVSFLIPFVPITSSLLSPLKQYTEPLSFRRHSFTYRAAICIGLPKIHFPWRHGKTKTVFYYIHE